MWTGSTWPPRCETKCASAPRRAGAAGRQVWGRRGPWGHQPSIPTRPCWQRARLTTLTFSPLTLGAAPPSPPASQGGGGGQRPAARTPALCTSCRVDPPVTLGPGRVFPREAIPEGVSGEEKQFPTWILLPAPVNRRQREWVAQAAMLALVPRGTTSLEPAPHRTQEYQPCFWQLAAASPSPGGNCRVPARHHSALPGIHFISAPLSLVSTPDSDAPHHQAGPQGS